jgi:glycosyltransferase involved in cell wall biosynthesis
MSVVEVSVVIPLRDEEPSVVPLHEELTRVMIAAGIDYEIILIDDGSVDGTFSKLAALHVADARVRVIRFTRNFGQTAGFAAGFAHARGRLIVTLDGDLQNDPADIPRLLSMADNHDVICGWRKDRQDNLLTRHLPSVIANWLVSLVSGVRLHDIGCSLKVFRAEVVRRLRLRPGMHRYLPALASQAGADVVEVVVHHRPRRFGRSKYGLGRTFRVAVDVLRLRKLMRQAVAPSSDPASLYEIAEILETAR